MKRILFLTLISFAVFAQTSEYRTSFFNKSTNQKLSGFSGYIYLVPQANTYPSGAITLLAVSGYDDYYYASAVPDGEYKVYIDLDKGGAGVPVVYRDKVWIGENRITTMANQFYSGMTDETEKLELNKYSDLEKAAVSPFQQKISENFEKVDSAVKYFDPRFFEVVGDEVTLNTTLYYSTLIPVVDTVINNDSTVSTSSSVMGYVKKSVDSLNTLNKLSNVAYKGQANNFGSFTQTASVFNSTSAIQLNGTSINTTGTLSNVAYKGQANNFTTRQTISYGTDAYALTLGTDGAMSLGGNNLGQFIVAGGRKLDATNATTFNSTILAISGNINFYSQTGLIAGSAFNVGTSRLTILGASGNVGINNTNPLEILDVVGNIKASGTITGTNHIAGSANYFYFGAEGTDGSWRIGRSGNNLVFERRESGSWVTKSTMTP